MMNKILALLALCAALASAQDGTPVNVSVGPPQVGYQTVYKYDVSNNLLSICYAQNTAAKSSNRFLTKVAISAATNASPVVFTSTGHGINLNTRPKVTISGGTGNWTAVNGEFVATPIDANSFSIPVDSTSLGALTGTLKFQTTAPLLNQPFWSVLVFAYDVNNNVISGSWLGGATGPGQKCSDSASTTLNLQ